MGAAHCRSSNDEDERLLAGLSLEQLADGPERFVGRPRALDEAESRADALCDQLCVLVSGEALRNRREELLSVELPDDLEQRPVRDPFSVRETTSLDDRRALAEALEELGDQA